VGRNRRNPSVVWVTCTDPRHKGTRDWQQRSYHLVAKLQFAERSENSRGPRITLHWDGDSSDPPVKNRRHDDGEWVFRFRCTCGRDVQRAESALVDIAQRYSAVFPGRRVEIDLVRLG
jgi:hypothetical protein